MRQGLVAENADRFAGVETHGRSRAELVLHIHQTLFDAHQRGIVRVFHHHVENRPAHRDESGGSGDALVIGAVAMLDLHADAAEPDLHQLRPAKAVAERDAAIGEDFKGAAVGDLELGVSVRPGKNDLLGRNGAAEEQRQRAAVLQHRDLPAQFHDLGDFLGRQRRQAHYQRGQQRHPMRGPPELHVPEHNTFSRLLHLK